MIDRTGVRAPTFGPTDLARLKQAIREWVLPNADLNCLAHVPRMLTQCLPSGGYTGVIHGALQDIVVMCDEHDCHGALVLAVHPAAEGQPERIGLYQVWAAAINFKDPTEDLPFKSFQEMKDYFERAREDDEMSILSDAGVEDPSDEEDA